MTVECHNFRKRTLVNISFFYMSGGGGDVRRSQTVVRGVNVISDPHSSAPPRQMGQWRPVLSFLVPV